MPIRRTRILRSRLVPTTLFALGLAACIAAPLAMAKTVQFHTSTTTPIDLGLPPAPLGITGTIKFSTNRADRRAQKAATEQERLRAERDANVKASTLANQRIVDIQELLATAQDDETKLRQEIQARMVQRYKDGDAGALEFMLSGDGFSDILSRSDLLKDQSARDQRTFADYDVTVQRIEDYQAVLEQLQQMTGDQAVRLDERANRLDDVLIAARASHAEEDEAPLDSPEKGKQQGLPGTWYIMDGAFQAQLFLPGGGGTYSGGTRTPRRHATPQEIQRALSDPRLVFDASGIQDVVTGQIDGRLLDALLLAAAKFNYVKVTALKGDHGAYTTSGNVSEHSFGCAADIGTIGHTYITPSAQLPGSEVEQAVLFFNGLGSISPDLAPHQVISLFSLGGATLAMGDHGDHIHVGYAC
jgi:hypothetical protein